MIKGVSHNNASKVCIEVSVNLIIVQWIAFIIMKLILEIECAIEIKLHRGIINAGNRKSQMEIIHLAEMISMLFC